MCNMSNEFQERVDRKSWSDIESLTTSVRILFCLPLILIFGFGFMAHTLRGSAAKHAERRYYIPLPTIILHVRFSVRCVRLFLVLDSSSVSYSYFKLDRLAVAFHALLDDVAMKQFLPFEIVRRFLSVSLLFSPAPSFFSIVASFFSSTTSPRIYLKGVVFSGKVLWGRNFSF